MVSTSCFRSRTTIRPVIPTKNATIPPITPIWKAAKPLVKPFWALYITVISPISVPVSVAIPSHVPTARPAPTKFVMLPAKRLTQKATATDKSRYTATIPQSKFVKLVWPVAFVRADSIRFYSTWSRRKNWAFKSETSTLSC